jgi:hypothetical protein
MAALIDDAPSPGSQGSGPEEEADRPRNQHQAPAAAAAGGSAEEEDFLEESEALVARGLAELDAAIAAAGDGAAPWAPRHPGLEKGLASRLAFLRCAKFDAAKVQTSSC